MSVANLYEFAKSAMVNKQKLCYIESGDHEQTLLFLHGMGSNIKAWSKNIPVLSERYRCVAIDVPGFGRSPKGANATDISQLSDTIALFIKAQAYSQVTLVGHSMGGLMSIMIASRYPELINKLILIAPAGIEEYSPQDAELIKTYFTADIIASYPSSMIRNNYKLNFYSMPEDAHFMIEDRLAMAKDKETFYEFARTMSETTYSIATNNVKKPYSTIDKPSLIFFGDNDKLIPHHIMHPERTTEAIAKEAEEIATQGRLIYYNNCGHFVQWEKSDEVNQEIMSFITI